MYYLNLHEVRGDEVAQNSITLVDANTQTLVVGPQPIGRMKCDPA